MAAAASIRAFAPDDIGPARALWQATPGIGLSAADEPAALQTFLQRNPGLGFVAEAGGQLVGTILCGHDGRRGLIHHLVTAPAARRRGIARALLSRSLAALQAGGIHKCHLLVFRDNAPGMAFWHAVATQRVELTLFSIDTAAAPAVQPQGQPPAAGTDLSRLHDALYQGPPAAPRRQRPTMPDTDHTAFDPAPAPALVIFDCDGVLVDSERISHEVLQALLAEHGVMLSFQQAVDRFIGTSLPVCLARVAELLGGPLPPAFAADFARRTREAFTQRLQPVPGIEGLLQALRVPFCVASNGNRAKVDFTLGHTGLLPRFAGRIFTADDVQHPKPAPDLFLHAAARMGSLPQHTIVVEDTPTGIRAAKAAGMHAIGFCGMTPALRLRDAGADALAQDVAQVAQLLAAAALHTGYGP